MERRCVRTPQGAVEYEFTRKRVKNFNMRMRPDGTLAVSAPMRTPARQADDFVCRKADWIASARRQMENRRAPGSTAHAALLGRAVPLGVERGGRPRILAADGAILLTCAAETPAEELLDAWRLRWAEGVFALAQARAEARFAGLPLPPVRSLRIRAMKSRWGSCIPAKGQVTLNAHLMKKPFGCIEYVAAHELCHLLVPNHGPDFYRLMDRVMPDHLARRALLNQPDAGI